MNLEQPNNSNISQPEAHDKKEILVYASISGAVLVVFAILMVGSLFQERTRTSAEFSASGSSIGTESQNVFPETPDGGTSSDVNPQVAEQYSGRSAQAPSSMRELIENFSTQAVRVVPMPQSQQPQIAAYSLTNFKVAEKRWFDRFAVGTIPTNSYKAFYFDSTKPTKVLKTEIVPKVAINYIYANGNGFSVRSEDFGGYWVGNIIISEPGIYTVSKAESWSNSRVIINNFELPNINEVKIDLQPGMYQVEVEYLNNWHTTDFAMTLEKERVTFSAAQIQQMMSELDGNFDVWYVGAYESSASDKTIAVQLQKKTIRPIVLMLSSYSQTEWNIQNTDGVDVAYVIYSSYEPGTKVVGVDAASVLKVSNDVLPTEYTIRADCTEMGPVFHCENINGLTKVDDSARALTGKTIASFSGDYSLKTVTAPGQIISDSVRASITQSYNDIFQKRKDYVGSQHIETIFDR